MNSFSPIFVLFHFDNSLCNIHAQGVANALPLAALTEGTTIRYRVRVMGVGKTLAAKHSRTSGCILQDCEKEIPFLAPATFKMLLSRTQILKREYPVKWRVLILKNGPSVDK